MCEWGHCLTSSAPSMRFAMRHLRIIVLALMGWAVASLTPALQAQSSGIPRVATAEAQIVGGFVVTATVTSPGFGYDAPPLVTITGGGGTGAKAMATVENGGVTAITITNPGSGYSEVPTVVVAPPPTLATSSTTLALKVTHSDLVFKGRYQLQVSQDLKTWVNLGDPFIADYSSSHSSYVDITPEPSYYRLKIVP